MKTKEQILKDLKANITGVFYYSEEECPSEYDLTEATLEDILKVPEFNQVVEEIIEEILNDEMEILGMTEWYTVLYYLVMHFFDQVGYVYYTIKPVKKEYATPTSEELVRECSIEENLKEEIIKQELRIYFEDVIRDINIQLAHGEVTYAI